MKTKLFLIASLISTGLIFTACQKDNELNPDSSLEQSVTVSGAADVAKIDGSIDSQLKYGIRLTNFPDPFVDKTYIRISLQKPTWFRLYVHELSTGKATLLFEGFKRQGKHEIVFDATNWLPGEYVAELISGKVIVKEKMFKTK